MERNQKQKGAEFERRKEGIHLEKDCLYALLGCDLCKGEVMRKDLRRHKTKECPERKVKCLFEKYGCKVGEISFISMEKHMAINESAHWQLKSDFHEKQVA